MLRQEKMDFARGAAADGIVLLKNENGALPLDKNKEIALFGTCAYRCFRLGWGSGDMMAQSISQINEGLKDAGYALNSELEAFCLDYIKDWEDQRLMNRSWDVWTWRQEEIKLDKSMIEAAAKKSDVAVITLGRCSGEAFDLKDEEGYFRLHADEIELVKAVSSAFGQTILLLNTCGPLDLRAIDECKIDALVDGAIGEYRTGDADANA